jgi:hypothetical protein
MGGQGDGGGGRGAGGAFSWRVGARASLALHPLARAQPCGGQPARRPPPATRRAAPPAARTVSLVGRIAMGFSICVVPLRVTHATSGAKPSTWSFSVLSTSSVMNSGK